MELRVPGTGQLQHLESELLLLRVEGVGPCVLPAGEVLRVGEPCAEGVHRVDAVVLAAEAVRGRILLDDRVDVPDRAAGDLDVEQEQVVVADIDRLLGELLEDDLAGAVVGRGPEQGFRAGTRAVGEAQFAGVVVLPVLQARGEFVDHEHIGPLPGRLRGRGGLSLRILPRPAELDKRRRDPSLAGRRTEAARMKLPISPPVRHVRNTAGTRTETPF